MVAYIIIAIGAFVLGALTASIALVHAAEKARRKAQAEWVGSREDAEFWTRYHETLGEALKAYKLEAARHYG